MSRQKLGQHFLTRAAVLERIACAACPNPPEPLVIEIGAGKGALTEHLLRRAARVIAVEIDPDLVEYLGQKFAGATKLTVVCGDARKIDLTQWGPATVTGNLPYYAATPLLEKALAAGEMLRHGIFLVQKEVADRLTARPGVGDYGYLSVRTQLFADVTALFDVPPAAFQPPPKVESTVVQVTPRARSAELGIKDSDAFLTLVSHAFRHKRKTLRNNLGPMYGKAEMDKWPEASLRAERLSIEEFASLFHRLSAEKGLSSEHEG